MIFDKSIIKMYRLFTIEGCNLCRIWKTVLPEYNIYLKGYDRIVNINCSRYHEYGIIDHPEIRRFAKYVKGFYPTLFEVHIDMTGRIVALFKRDGANSEVEVRAWLKAFVFDKLPRFVKEQPDDAIFNEEDFDDRCKIKEKLFGGIKVACT